MSISRVLTPAAVAVFLAAFCASCGEDPAQRAAERAVAAQTEATRVHCTHGARESVARIYICVGHARAHSGCDAYRVVRTGRHFAVRQYASDPGNCMLPPSRGLH